jgi:hypothetical protein
MRPGTRAIYVRLDSEQVSQLVRIAESERRHPSDQAAVMLAPMLAGGTEQREAKT